MPEDEAASRDPFPARRGARRPLSRGSSGSSDRLDRPASMTRRTPRESRRHPSAMVAPLARTAEEGSDSPPGDLVPGRSCIAVRSAQGRPRRPRRPPCTRRDRARDEPTFTIGHRYRGRVDVSHLDLYRYERLSDAEWGISRGTRGGAIVFVEWPEAGEAALPRPRARVRLARRPRDPARRCRRGRRDAAGQARCRMNLC